MDNETIKSALIKIELIWATTSKEKSDDLRSFEYITNQAIALRVAVSALKAKVEQAIHQHKKDRLKFQKLHHSLSNIIEVLDYETTPCKDENYIQDILDKLRKIGVYIKEILEYE